MALVSWAAHRRRFRAWAGQSRPHARPRQIETDLPADHRRLSRCRRAGRPDRASTCRAATTAKKYILETTGTGVAIFDYDSDGLLDVFLANATTLDGDGAGERRPSHLYRNRGGLTFEDVTERAGLDARRAGDRASAPATTTTTATRDLFVTYFGAERRSTATRATARSAT